MLVLKTDVELNPEWKEQLRSKVKETTGEDCLILDMGLTLEQIELKRERPFWCRLFWKN